MALPIYEKAEIKYGNLDSIIEQLKEYPLGQSPIYIMLPEILESEIFELITLICTALKKLKVNPYFPYPIYLITLFHINSTFIPVLKSPADLPKLFKVQKKRAATKKETSILSKIEILINKLNNSSVDNTLREFKKNKLKYRRLFELSRENTFYEKVLDSEKIKLHST